jgi:drug/metabolite transporter (DMT)-like permease
MRLALPISAASLQPSSLVLGIACGTGAAFCWAAGFVAARHGILKGLAPADIALHRFVLALGEIPTVYQLAGLAVVALGFRLALKQ